MKTQQTHSTEKVIQLFEDIEKYGLHILYVPASDYLPSFGYTVGLYKTYNHPEIIAFGMSGDAIQAIMNNIGDILKSGKQMELNKIYYDFFENVPSQFIAVDKRYTKNYFGYGIWFYETLEFPTLQLVWADRQNHFPWDVEYAEEFRYRQPLLDRNADFKFREEKNLAVFTTRQHLELNKPIVRVVHDDDGDWQFLTGDQMPEDIKMVCLEDILNADYSITDLFDLEYGESAERESIYADWKRTTENEENGSR